MNLYVTIVGHVLERQLKGCLSACAEAGFIPVRIFRINRSDMLVEGFGGAPLYVRVLGGRKNVVSWSFDPRLMSHRTRSLAAQAKAALLADLEAPVRKRQLPDGLLAT